MLCTLFASYVDLCRALPRISPTWTSTRVWSRIEASHRLQHQTSQMSLNQTGIALVHLALSSVLTAQKVFLSNPTLIDIFVHIRMKGLFLALYVVTRLNIKTILWGTWHRYIPSTSPTPMLEILYNNFDSLNTYIYKYPHRILLRDLIFFKYIRAYLALFFN